MHDGGTGNRRECEDQNCSRKEDSKGVECNKNTAEMGGGGTGSCRECKDHN